MMNMPHRARLIAAAAAWMLAASPHASNADIPPYPQKRPPRPECGLVIRIDHLRATRMPRAAIAARGTALSARRGNTSLQYRGISGAGTPRATALFDWTACGYPGARGTPVIVRAAADVPGNPGAEIRFVRVRAAGNAITVRL